MSLQRVEPVMVFNATALVAEVSDFLLHDVDPRVLDVAAGACIGLGGLFALFGSKLIRTASFLIGAVLGATIAYMVCAELQLELEAALATVGASALAFGLLTLCMLRLAKVLIGAAIALATLAFANQAGFAAAVHHSGLYWAMVGVLVVACAAVSFVAFRYTVAAGCAVVGAFVFALGLGRFVDADVDMKEMLVHPEAASCAERDYGCASILISGAVLAVAGVLIQWALLYGERGRSGDKAPPASAKGEPQEAPRPSRTAVVPRENVFHLVIT